MSLATLLTDVYAITNRPDLVTESQVAIQKATLKAHLFETFPRDLVELTIAPPTSISTIDFKYQLDITSAPFARFRKLFFARETPNTNPNSTPWDNVNGAASWVNQFTLIESDSIMDSFATTRTNFIYQSGSSLTIRASHQLLSVDVSYYQSPDVSIASYSSWIADDYGFVIVLEAAAQVFKAIGKDDEFQRFSAFWAENMHILQVNNINP